MPAALMEATPLSGLPIVLSGLSALDELCMEKERQLAILAVVAVWKVPLFWAPNSVLLPGCQEHGVRDP